MLPGYGKVDRDNQQVLGVNSGHSGSELRVSLIRSHYRQIGDRGSEGERTDRHIRGTPVEFVDQGRQIEGGRNRHLHLIELPTKFIDSVKLPLKPDNRRRMDQVLLFD